MIKNLTTIITFIVLGTSLLYSFEYKGLEYEVISTPERTCRLVMCNSLTEYLSDGTFTLPSIVYNGTEKFTVVSIGSNAMTNINVTGIILPESIDVLEENAITGTKATSIHLPTSLHCINDYALQDNHSLQSIVIPAMVTYLGNGALRGCSELSKLTIEANINSIPAYCFADCSSISDLDISNKIISVEEHAFDGCSSLKDFDFANIEVIGERAFAGCKSLTDIRLTSSLETLPSGAFEHCESLHTFVAGKCISSIGDEAFYGCSMLSQIELGESVEDIGSRAFKGCNTLQRIYSLNAIPPTIQYDTFDKSTVAYASLLVKPEDRNRYLFTPIWIDFYNIIPCEDFPLIAEKILGEESRMLFSVSAGELRLQSNRPSLVCSAEGIIIYSGIPLQQTIISLTERHRIIIISNSSEHHTIIVR